MQKKKPEMLLEINKIINIFNYIFKLTFQSPFSKCISKVNFHFENGLWKVRPKIS